MIPPMSTYNAATRRHTISICDYVVWLRKLDAMRAEIHDAPRKRRIRSFKRCAKVMRKKGFSDEFIRVAMGPLFTEDADW